MKYLIVGCYYNSTKQFRIETQNYGYAMCINLWRGKVYRVDGRKRQLIKEVTN